MRHILSEDVRKREKIRFDFEVNEKRASPKRKPPIISTRRNSALISSSTTTSPTLRQGTSTLPTVDQDFLIVIVTKVSAILSMS